MCNFGKFWLGWVGTFGKFWLISKPNKPQHESLNGIESDTILSFTETLVGYTFPSGT